MARYLSGEHRWSNSTVQENVFAGLDIQNSRMGRPHPLIRLVPKKWILFEISCVGCFEFCCVLHFPSFLAVCGNMGTNNGGSAVRRCTANLARCQPRWLPLSTSLPPIRSARPLFCSFSSEGRAGGKGNTELIFGRCPAKLLLSAVYYSVWTLCFRS